MLMAVALAMEMVLVKMIVTSKLFPMYRSFCDWNNQH